MKKASGKRPGRPKKGPVTEVVSFSIRKETLEKLNALAPRLIGSTSGFVSQLIDLALDDPEYVNQFTLPDEAKLPKGVRVYKEATGESTKASKTEDGE